MMLQVCHKHNAGFIAGTQCLVCRAEDDAAMEDALATERAAREAAERERDELRARLDVAIHFVSEQETGDRELEGERDRWRTQAAAMERARNDAQADELRQLKINADLARELSELRDERAKLLEAIENGSPEDGAAFAGVFWDECERMHLGYMHGGTTTRWSPLELGKPEDVEGTDHKCREVSAYTFCEEFESVEYQTIGYLVDEDLLADLTDARAELQAARMPDEIAETVRRLVYFARRWDNLSAPWVAELDATDAWLDARKGAP